MALREGVHLRVAPIETPTETERFFDYSADLLCVAGLDGYFKQLNGNWQRVLGYTDRELLSRPYLDFVHPDDRDITRAEAAKVALGIETIHFRNRYLCRDGTYRWLAWTGRPVLETGLVYASARDVTDETAAEEEELSFTRRRLERIQEILQSPSCKMVFQPIVDFTTGEVIGAESLARFKAPPQQPPDHWFAEADDVGLRPELELHAVELAVPFAARLAKGTFLSVNVSPETLLTKDFSAIAEQVEGSRLVVEVTEHAAVSDYEQLNRAVSRLRRHGIRLAIDDAGAGFSSLKHIIRLVPEFIKLDMFLTRDIHTDPAKRALASAMVAFAREIGATLIAEGVENSRELGVLGDLGVEDAQGYYLGRPSLSLVQGS